MAKYKSRRRVALDRPEEVLSLAQRWLEPVRRQWKWLLAAVLIVALGWGAWGITDKMRARQEEQASEALSKARPQTGGGEANPESVKALEGVIKEFPGARAAWEAELLRANLLYRLKNYAEAAKAYESLLDGRHPGWDALISESLSYCYEGLGDSKKALEVLKPLADQITGAWRGEVLRRLALLSERIQDPQQAALYWQKLLDQPPDPSMVPYLKEKVAANSAPAKK